MSEPTTLFARDLHVLWRLFKVMKSSTIKVGDFSARVNETFGLTDQVEPARLLEVAKYLGLVVLNNKVIEMTSTGRAFADSYHWRHFKPNSEMLEKLARYGLQGAFIIKEERPVVIDLFAGVGGLTLGFEAAGFDVGLSIDNDPQACEAHRKNFPNSVVRHEGVELIAQNPKAYVEKIASLKGRKIAGVVGGPPCQGFSYIGERVTGDARNLLTSRFMDVVEGLEPDFFLMENVPGLANSGIPPKFAGYITVMAKSIGEPAMAIVNILPKAPNTLAKRDKQFRKKLMSKVVTEFKASLEMPSFESRRAAASISKSVAVLEAKVSSAISETYTGEDLKDALANLDKMNEQIVRIALGAYLERLLSENLIKEAKAEDFLKAVAAETTATTQVSQSILDICKEYDAAPQATRHKGKFIGPILQNLIDRASDKYEICGPVVLNAAWFGAPQNRTRLFFIGIHKRIECHFEFPDPIYNDKDPQALRPLGTKIAIGDLPDIDLFGELVEGHELSFSQFSQGERSDYAAYMRLEKISADDKFLPRPDWNPYVLDCCNRTLHADFVVERLKATSQGMQDKTSHKTRLHPEKPSPTLRAGTREAKGSHTAVRPVHYEHHRVVSVREGARIMGYPDWMTFHKTKWHGFRLVGNGVPFQLAKHVALAIKSTLIQKQAAVKKPAKGINAQPNLFLEASPQLPARSRSARAA